MKLPPYVPIYYAVPSVVGQVGAAPDSAPGCPDAQQMCAMLAAAAAFVVALLLACSPWFAC